MDEEKEFDELMQRVQAGCPDAARELYDRYSAHIRRVVRRQLHQRMRAQFDSADFLQSVWASFFTEVPDRFKFETPEALVNFLCEVAFNKVTTAFRQQVLVDKRTLNREQSLDSLGAADEANSDPRGASPSQLAMAKERWEKLLLGQPKRNRAILEMLRQGHTHDEIATKLGVHRKLVQRLVQRLLRKLNGAVDTS